jgi:hypothetical protein
MGLHNRHAERRASRRTVGDMRQHLQFPRPICEGGKGTTYFPIRIQVRDIVQHFDDVR